MAGVGGQTRVLFLGRIDLTKGTEFPRGRREGDVRVSPLGAGDGRPGLPRASGCVWRQLLVRHSGRETTVFVGSVFDQDKRNLLASCDLLVQPSFPRRTSGSLIAELLASCVFCDQTRTTPWSVIETRKLGWWIEVGAEPLYNAMRTTPVQITGRAG